MVCSWSRVVQEVAEGFEGKVLFGFGFFGEEAGAGGDEEQDRHGRSVPGAGMPTMTGLPLAMQRLTTARRSAAPRERDGVMENEAPRWVIRPAGCLPKNVRETTGRAKLIRLF